MERTTAAMTVAEYVYIDQVLPISTISARVLNDTITSILGSATAITDADAVTNATATLA